jgi:hypothetical protein
MQFLAAFPGRKSFATPCQAALLGGSGSDCINHRDVTVLPSGSSTNAA